MQEKEELANISTNQCCANIDLGLVINQGFGQDMIKLLGPQLTKMGKTLPNLVSSF